jgi:mRNA interferase MazF
MADRYIPRCNDVISLDLEPVKGKEMGKRRPVLVLSDERYNKATGLVVFSPISTSIRGGNLEVAIDCLDKKSVVSSGFVQTMSWIKRDARYICTAETGVRDKVILNILPLIGASEVIEKYL